MNTLNSLSNKSGAKHLLVEPRCITFPRSVSYPPR